VPRPDVSPDETPQPLEPPDPAQRFGAAAAADAELVDRVTEEGEDPEKLTAHSQGPVDTEVAHPRGRA